jgi:hypothetical protein
MSSLSSMSRTAWEGLALRRMRAAPEPEEAPRAVALPAAWDDGAEEAAAAIAALAPGQGPVALPRLAEAWISRLARQGLSLSLLASAEEAAACAAELRALLLARRGAPGAGIWRNDAKTPARFVLNLPAFLDPEGGFDFAGYAEAVALGIRALDIMGGGKATRLSLGFADLAGLLAGFGLAYDSDAGRAAGAAIAALTRGAAEAESGRLAERFGAREPLALIWPSPPVITPVPGLAEAARAALDAAAASTAGLRHASLLALSPPDAVEALLGAETGGLAPAPGPTTFAFDAEGEPQERPTRAARRAGPARAITLLAPVSGAARLAMAHAVAPFLHAVPPMPVAETAPPRPAPAFSSAPSARQTGATWRATVGGHRVVLRTTEDAAGRPQELAISLSKEAAAYRSLMDAFAHSVSLGLARGTPLEAYVEAFAYTRFGPAGAVEGDPAIRQATSVLDWAFRRLALEYLGRRDLADPTEEDLAPDALGRGAAEQAPLLPLDLPDAPSPRARRRALRVVA